MNEWIGGKRVEDYSQKLRPSIINLMSHSAIYYSTKLINPKLSINKNQEFLYQITI